MATVVPTIHENLFLTENVEQPTISVRPKHCFLVENNLWNEDFSHFIGISLILQMVLIFSSH